MEVKMDRERTAQAGAAANKNTQIAASINS